MKRRIGLALVLSAFVGGCGLIGSRDRVPVEPSPVPIPGPLDELPMAVGQASGWTDAIRRLPPDLAPDARYADALDAIDALTDAFDADGTSSSPLFGSDTEIRLLFTIPAADGSDLWGEQYFVVLASGDDGWQLAQAWSRDLCKPGPVATRRCA